MNTTSQQPPYNSTTEPTDTTPIYVSPFKSIKGPNKIISLVCDIPIIICALFYVKLWLGASAFVAFAGFYCLIFDIAYLVIYETKKTEKMPISVPKIMLVLHVLKLALLLMAAIGSTINVHCFHPFSSIYSIGLYSNLLGSRIAIRAAIGCAAGFCYLNAIVAFVDSLIYHHEWRSGAPPPKPQQPMIFGQANPICFNQQPILAYVQQPMPGYVQQPIPANVQQPIPGYVRQT